MNSKEQKEIKDINERITSLYKLVDIVEGRLDTQPQPQFCPKCNHRTLQEYRCSLAYLYEKVWACLNCGIELIKQEIMVEYKKEVTK